MKKTLILALCAAMAFGAFAAPVQAAAQPKRDNVYEGERGGPDRRPDHNRPGGGGGGGGGGHRPPPPPPPRPDYDRRHDRRRSGGGNGWLGFGIGAAIGTAIGAAIANSAPTPQQTMVYDPACNCYYYR